MLCRHFRVLDLPAFFRIYQNLPALPSCHRKYRHLTFPSTYPVQDRWSEGQGRLFLCRVQHSAGETAELSFPSLRDFVFLEATSVIMFVPHKVVIGCMTEVRATPSNTLKTLHFYGMTHGFLNKIKEKLP